MIGLANAQWNYEQPLDDAPDDTRMDAEEAVEAFNEECGGEYEAELFEWVHDNKMTILVRYDYYIVATLTSIEALDGWLAGLKAWVEFAPVDENGNFQVFLGEGL